jgi:DNA-binding SARP family transcriptional activator
VSGDLKFTVLGPVRAWWGDVEVNLGSPQQRAVLAMLLQGAQVPVERIISGLWFEAPDTARQMVRTYIHRLRAALSGPGSTECPLIVSASGGYYISVGPDQIDAKVFHDKVVEAQRAAEAGAHARAVEMLDAALALWRGSPLAGIPGEFASMQRLQLTKQRARAMEAKANSLLELAAYGEAEHVLDELIGEDPLNERFRELKMLSLYRAGRQAESLEVFRGLQHLLADQLGVDPGQALQALQLRILQADPSLLPPPPLHEQPAEPAEGRHRDVPGTGGDAIVGGRAAVRPDPVVQHSMSDVPLPHQLPADQPWFVGREAELKRATAVLAQADHDPRAASVVVVSGMAGVGKTAFAVHWAHQIAAQFPDGEIYLNLRGFHPTQEPLSSSQALAALLDSVGARTDGSAPDVDRQAAYLRSVMSGKRLLIVLDNARDADQVRPLLPGDSTSMVIVTSRNHLRGLSVVDGASLIQLEVMSEEEGVDLLSRRVADAPSKVSLAELAELADHCRGLPLALSICAARIATSPDLPLPLSFPELYSGDAESLDLYVDVDAASSLRSVFSWSIEALSPQAVRLFTLLALPRSCSWDEATVATLGNLTVASARLLLHELAAANLIVRTSAQRHGFHELVRLYASELAAGLEPDERRSAVNRLLDHYAIVAQRADAILNPHRTPIALNDPLPGTVLRDFAGHSSAWSWFVGEHDSVIASQELAVEEGFDQYAWQLGWVLETFLYRSGRWEQALASQQVALAASERLGDAEVQAGLHHGVGRVLIRLGRHDDAWGHLIDSTRRWEEAGSPERAASAVLSLANLVAKEGQSEKAIKLYQLVLSRTTSPLLRAMAVNNLGSEYTAMGRHELALELCSKALVLWSEIGDKHAQASTWDSLGTAYQGLKRYDSAVSAYGEAVSAFERMGDRFNQAGSLAKLGDCLAELGDDARSNEMLTKALAILVDLHHPQADGVRSKLRQLKAS